MILDRYVDIGIEYNEFEWQIIDLSYDVFYLLFHSGLTLESILVMVHSAIQKKVHGN